MKVKDLIKQLQQLDQEAKIVVCNANNAYNFTSYTSSFIVSKREMQYRNDLFNYSKPIFDEKKYKKEEIYVIE